MPNSFEGIKFDRLYMNLRKTENLAHGNVNDSLKGIVKGRHFEKLATETRVAKGVTCGGSDDVSNGTSFCL